MRLRRAVGRRRPELLRRTLVDPPLEPLQIDPPGSAIQTDHQGNTPLIQRPPRVHHASTTPQPQPPPPSSQPQLAQHREPLRLTAVHNGDTSFAGPSAVLGRSALPRPMLGCFFAHHPAAALPQSAGQPCPEVILINYQTGEEVALSSIVGNGKPTVIDYCALPCLPVALFWLLPSLAHSSMTVLIALHRAASPRQTRLGEARATAPPSRCRRNSWSLATPPTSSSCAASLPPRRRWHLLGKNANLSQPAPAVLAHPLSPRPVATSQINIEGGSAPCSAFNDKHSLTLPHFGLKDKAEIGPFGVQYIPHHVAIAADGSVQESPSQSKHAHRNLIVSFSGCHCVWFG